MFPLKRRITGGLFSLKIAFYQLCGFFREAYSFRVALHYDLEPFYHCQKYVALKKPLSVK